MTQYTLNPSVVRKCVQRLLDEQINRTFPYYLCLQQRSAIMERQSHLNFPFQSFLNNYFRVEEVGEKIPFFVPFSDVDLPIESLWFPENLNTGFKPTSLPPTSPLRKVATVEKKNDAAKWGLKDEHWKSARFDICHGSQVPVESLAAYLFRDFAFQTEEPSAVTIVKTFTREFGYVLGGKAFSHLYQIGDSEITSEAFETNE